MDEIKVDKISTKNFLKLLGGKRGFDKLESLLKLKRGQLIPFVVQADYIWGDREDGGPQGAQNITKIYVHRLRKFGLKIDCIQGGNLGLDLNLLRFSENRGIKKGPKKKYQLDFSSLKLPGDYMDVDVVGKTLRDRRLLKSAIYSRAPGRVSLESKKDYIRIWRIQ